MVRDQSDRDVLLLVRSVRHPRCPADLVAYRFHCVDVKHGIYILNDHCKSLEPHAGIDILLRKLLVIALSVAVKLREYVVPDFHKTVTVTPHLAVGSAAPVFDASVIVDLRTRSARSGAMLPEVVTLPGLRVTVKARDLFSRHSDLIDPYIIGFLILAVNRRVQSLRIKSDYFGQKLPAPCERLALEIISKRKISKHLKKSEVPCCLADILDITCPDTLLTCGDTAPRRYLLPCKIWL